MDQKKRSGRRERPDGGSRRDAARRSAREMLVSYPQICFDGDRSAVFSGCAGVYEIENDRIGIVVGGMLMRLYGSELEIVSLSGAETVVTGRFTSLTFDS